MIAPREPVHAVSAWCGPVGVEPEAKFFNDFSRACMRVRARRCPFGACQALLLLERRARGNYEPDELPKSFPQFAPQSQRPATGLSPRELFDAWVKARKPAPGTIESWSTV